MTEFSSSVELLVKPDQTSIRSAKQEIESSLADVEAGVSTTGASSQAARGSNSQFAGKERAMSRQLLNTSNTHLETVTDHLDYGIELDEARNELLQELVDETESGNFTRAKGGGGALGLLAGGLGLAALVPTIAGSVGEAISNVDFSGVLGGVGLEASDVIGTAATVTAGAVIGQPASIAAADLIGSEAGVAAADVIGAAAQLAAGDLIAATATITASSVIGETVALSSGDVIGAAAELAATDVVGVAAEIAAGSLIASTATVIASDLIAEKASLNPGDLIDIPEGGINLERLVLGAVAAGGATAAGARVLQGGGASGAAGASAGAGMPVLAPEWLPEGSTFRTNPATGEDVAPSVLTPRGRQERLGGLGEWLNSQLGTPTQPQRSAGGGGRSSETARDRADRRAGGGRDITVNNEFRHARSDREIERIIDRKLQTFQRELERDLTRR